MRPFAAALSCAALSAIGTCRGSASNFDSADAAVPAAAAGRDAGLTCRDSAACRPGQYCDFEPGLCGRGNRPGTCRAKPAACDSAYAPVCGCDGVIYDSECAANAAGVNLAVRGCEAVLPDRASCGPRYCDLRKEYCEIFLSDVFDLPTNYFCRPLPPTCLPRPEDGGPQLTCECFPAGTRCLNFCGPMESRGVRGFHLTCQGVSPPRDDRR